MFHFISAPRAELDVAGHPAVLDVDGTPGVLNLKTLPPFEVDLKKTSAQKTGALDVYITILADGADIGLIFGADKAAVTGANVPSLGQAGSVDGDGVYTPHIKECFVIKSGTEKDFIVSSDRPFMGFVGSGAGKMRIFQSSPQSL